ncbi:hypothetical protein SHO565_58690 [Streptomyces sp. HO565]
MESVRLTRWMLPSVPTVLLWRRMKLWELRSYEQVIKLEQECLVYQASLRSRYGRAWRRKAPVEALIMCRHNGSHPSVSRSCLAHTDRAGFPSRRSRLARAFPPIAHEGLIQGRASLRAAE